MRYCFLLLGLMVFACEDRPDEKGNEEMVAAEPPKVWIEAGAGLPSGESSANSLEIKVTGNDRGHALSICPF